MPRPLKFMRPSTPLVFRDPLEDFDWSTLGAAYQCKTPLYNPNSPFLTCLAQPPTSDQGLYRLLVQRFADETKSGISFSTYQAMLYWKLYSQQRYLVRISKALQIEPSRTDTQNALREISSAFNAGPLPDRSVSHVRRMIKVFDRFPAYGMKTPTALAVRATFLHFCFPEIMPLYDKNVLLAVIINLPKEAFDVLPTRMDTLEQYVPFAWNLATKYGDKVPADWPETPVRLIDMALWVLRGTPNRVVSCHSGNVGMWS